MRTPGRVFGTILLFGLLAALGGGACAGRMARVPVSEEDLRRAQVALREGDLAFARQDYYAALIRYLEGSNHNPNSEVIANRLGVSYAKLGFYDRAEETFRRTVRLNPEFAQGYSNLGAVYFLKNSLRRAERNLKKAIRLNDGEASFHLNLGTLYLEKNRVAEALEEWRRAHELDPLSLSGGSAVSLARGGRTSPGERAFMMARLYARQGDTELALRNLRQAIALGFSDADAIRGESDFEPLRRDPRFADFLSNLDALIQLQDKGDIGAAAP